MHDPHLFRIFEFNRCFIDGQFPCRWASDSGKGYGEPLFNFYAQAPYWFTQKFIILGFSILDSAKIAYILSLVLSGFSMYLYARKLWGNRGGLISALFYVYAPYRAVDVWVRGALPEALAFIVYPLTLLFIDLYLESHKKIFLLAFSLSLFFLINIHNLSFLMFVPFLGIYWFVKSWHTRSIKSVWAFLTAGLFAVSLSAFYLLPVIFESSLVTLGETVKGYYDYHIHFTTLRELFITRFWGYGASLWQKKYLSVSIGQLHWLIPVLLSLIIVFRKNINRITVYCLLFTGLGFFALFLTHGKSSLIWDLIPPMKFIQFPWRFLTIAVFFISLASGYVGNFLQNKKYLNLLITLVILINFPFFRPDIWRNHTDAQTFSGSLWDEARSSSLTDFWPNSSPEPPSDFAFYGIKIVSGGNAWIISQNKKSNSAQFEIFSESDSIIAIPIVYFPGWKISVNGIDTEVIPAGKLGLISFSVSPGHHYIQARFINTRVRTVGNMISLLALFSIPLWFLKKRQSLSYR